jgi:hypothetical protein
MSTHAVWLHPMGRDDVFDREIQPPYMLVLCASLVTFAPVN